MGAGLSAGTDGISIDAAYKINKYLSASVGMSIMYNLTFKDTYDVDFDHTVAGQSVQEDVEIEAKAKLKRTTFDVKLDFYPFANRCPLFIVGGFSFGGKKLLKLSGHSDRAQELIAQGERLGVDIDNYFVELDKNGDVNGDLRVKSVRPYLGLGYGRLVPKKRLAFRVELGAQFEGKPKIYANGKKLEQTLIGADDDDISDVIDLLKVYPVLKFSLRGRIL